MGAELFTFGETMSLLTPEAGRPFDPATPLCMRFAGAESNVAITAARLGIRTAWYTRLGQDPVGEWIHREVTAQGVETGAVAFDSNRVTGMMLKVRQDGATAQVYYYRKYSAASAISPEGFPYELLSRAGWVHVTGITPALSESARAAWLRAIEVAREHAIPISLDPNVRLKLWTAEEARSLLLGVLEKGVDLFLPNQDEAVLLFGDQAPELLVRAAHSAGARRVALKLGDRGALLSEGAGITFVPVWGGLPVLDPVGAGDAFAGGLVAGILKGLPLREAGRVAAYCGARAVTRVGDWEGAPTWAEVEMALQGGDLVERSAH